MIVFNEKSKKYLCEISGEFRTIARNRVDANKVDFPYMDAMSWLLSALATMDIPFCEMEDFCKHIIEGANLRAQSLIAKPRKETEESALPTEGGAK